MTKIHIVCDNCSYEWDYEGNMKYYATCPDCKRNNAIREQTKANFDKVYGIGDNS